jgi:hypothetical protein
MATIYNPITYGVTANDVGGHVREAPQAITLSLPATDVTLVGDSHSLFDHASGGANTLQLNTQNSALLVGDALSLTDHAQGGHNTLSLFALLNGEIIGDAVTMGGHSIGGYNTIHISGGLSQATAIGDAETLNGYAQGGHNNILATGNRTAIVLMGDAMTMTDHAQGGHNTLTGAEAGFMYGDAQVISGYAQGGHNTLIDATKIGDQIEFPTVMYGDGLQLLGHASGGFNTLVSGFDADIMWGTAPTVSPLATTGPDTFVFSPPNGHDQIMDFRPSEDVIQLDGFGFTSFADLSSHFEPTPNGVLISFDAQDDILLHGVTANQLTAADFAFG